MAVTKLFVLLSSVLLLSGCSGSQPQVTRASAPRPSGDELIPEGLPPSADATCQEAEAQVKTGLALQDDLNVAVLCVVDRLAENQVGPFLERARAVKLLERPVKCLPEALRQRLPEKVSGRSIRLYASAEGRELLTGECQQLGPGTWRGMEFSVGRGSRGHSDATRLAALSVRQSGVRLSDAAITLLADAAQDADFFQWENMAAHGQTPDTEGLPMDAKTAREDSARWVGAHLARARELCEKPDETSVRHALYWTGYALHAIEDIASHRGRTNPEHSYNAHQEFHNPDEHEDSFKLSVDMATQFLVRALHGPLKGCGTHFASYSGGPVLYPEKVGALRLQRDFTPTTVSAYKEAWRVFDKVKEQSGVRVRWFGTESTGPHKCLLDPGCQAVLDRMLQVP